MCKCSKPGSLLQACAAYLTYVSSELFLCWCSGRQREQPSCTDPEGTTCRRGAHVSVRTEQQSQTDTCDPQLQKCWRVLELTVTFPGIFLQVNFCRSLNMTVGDVSKSTFHVCIPHWSRKRSESSYRRICELFWHQFSQVVQLHQGVAESQNYSARVEGA